MYSDPHHGSDLIRLDDPAVLADLPATWNRLLDAYPGGLAPVYLEAGVRAWLMLTWPVHQRVLNSYDFLRDVRFWADFQSGVLPADSPWRERLAPRRNPWCVDGELHSQYSNGLAQAFDQVNQAILETDVRAIADLVIDGFCEQGRVDLVAHYASVLPMIALCRLIGMSEQEGVIMCKAMARVWAGDGEQAHAQVTARVLRLVQERRANPSGDLTTQLIALGLDDEEVCDHITLIIAAGHEPVANLISTALRMMLDSRAVRRDMGSSWLVRETLNDCLWKSPPLAFIPGRFPRTDVAIGGQNVRAGDCLILGFGPVQQDMLRQGVDTASNKSYFVFGGGPHACPQRARTLAMTISEVAIQRLDQRLPDLVHLPDQARETEASMLSGMESLPAVFTPASPIRPERRTAAEAPESSPDTAETGSRKRGGFWDRLLRSVRRD